MAVEYFSSEIQYISACVCYAVGFSPLIAMPYLFYRFGQLFALIFFFLFLVVGFGAVHLEQVMGTISGYPIIRSLRKLSPISEGIGWAMTLTCWFVSIYYAVYVAWSLFYLLSSFRTSLAIFTKCDHSWNTEHCYSPSDMCINMMGSDINRSCVETKDVSGRIRTSAEEYMLRAAHGVQLDSNADASIYNVPEGTWLPPILMVPVLIAIWILLFFLIQLCPRLIGTISTVFMMFSLIILFLIPILLPIFEPSIRDILPEFKQLHEGLSGRFDFEMVKTAMVRVLFVSGAGIGVFTTFASWRSPKYEQGNVGNWLSLILTPIIILIIHSTASQCAYSIHSLFWVHVAKTRNVAIDDIVASGFPSLFVMLPEGAASLNFGPLWLILIYTATFLLGFGSLFCMMVNVFANLMNILQQDRWKFCTAGLLCFVSLIAGIFLSSPTGQKWVSQLDTILWDNVFAFILLICFILAYVYGWQNIQLSLGLKLGIPSSWPFLARLFSPVSSIFTGQLLVILPNACMIALYYSISESSWRYTGSLDANHVIVIEAYWLRLLFLLIIVGIGFLKGIHYSIEKKSLKLLLRPDMPRSQEAYYTTPLGSAAVCWCCCSYHNTVLVPLVVDSIFLAAKILYVLYILSHTLTIGTVFLLFVVILEAAALISVLMAYRKRSANLLIPYLVYNSMFILTSLLIGAILSWILHVDESGTVVVVIAVLLFMSVKIWFIALIVGYHWLLRTDRSSGVIDAVPLA